MLHNKKIDYFLFLTAIVVLAVFLVINFPLKTANSPRQTYLFISPHYAQLFGGDIMAALIQEFEEQNPGLRIREADSGQPDIVFFDEGQFNDLVRQEELLSLAPYIPAENGADQRAMPLVSFMDLLAYNIEILQAAGFDRPPKTRAEFLACARTVAGQHKHSDAAIYGAAIGLSPDDPLSLRREIYSWIWAAGGEIHPPEHEGREPELSGTAAEIIAFFRQLEREGLFAPETFTKTGVQRVEEFIEGKIAMLTISAQDLPLLQKRMSASSFGITAIPAANNQGKTHVGLSSMYAGIGSECSRPDDAWIFLSFLAEKRQVLTDGLRAVPGHFTPAFSGLNIFAVNLMTEDPLYSKAWDIFEAAEIAGFSPGHPAEAELERFVRQKLME